MPTFYPPGTRKTRKNGRVYTNKFYVVRGRVNGKAHEVTTDRLRKKGDQGAESWWEDFVLGIRAGSRADPTAETADFLDAAMMYRQARDLSPNESRYLNALEAHFGPTARLLADYRPQHLIDAANAIYPGRKPQTKNRQAVRPAAAVLHHAARNGLCNWLRPVYFEEIDPNRPFRTVEQGEAAIEAATAQGRGELAVLLTTLVYQGWRIGETLKLRRDAVNWQKAVVRRWVAKSRKWKWAPVVAEVIAAWRTLGGTEDGRLFTFENRWQVYKAIDGLGLSFKLRPHMNRRGFARALKDAGVDAMGIAEAGAWDSTRSVEPYVGTDIDRARRNLEKLRGTARGKTKKAV